MSKWECESCWGKNVLASQRVWIHRGTGVYRDDNDDTIASKRRTLIIDEEEEKGVDMCIIVDCDACVVSPGHGGPYCKPTNRRDIRAGLVVDIVFDHVVDRHSGYCSDHEDDDRWTKTNSRRLTYHALRDITNADIGRDGEGRYELETRTLISRYMPSDNMSWGGCCGDYFKVEQITVRRSDGHDLFDFDSDHDSDHDSDADGPSVVVVGVDCVTDQGITSNLESLDDFFIPCDEYAAKKSAIVAGCWYKPDGIWFSHGSWLYNCYHDRSHEEHCDELNGSHAILIQDPMNILTIQTKEEFIAFHDRYQTKSEFGFTTIGWEAVKTAGFYGVAFEFCKTADIGIPFCSEYMWHSTFDVESLCVWDLRAFGNTKRKNKEQSSYINHPIGVMNLLASVGGVTDRDMLAAAVLHDTVEDTDVTMAQIRAEFGDRVALFVKDATDDKALSKVERKRAQITLAPSRVSISAAVGSETWTWSISFRYQDSPT